MCIMASRNNVNTLQIQSTNDASIISKCSMAKSNYVKDNFLHYFVEKQKSRASLIHLGYYTRSVIFSGILVQFIKFLHLQKILKFQIISCGSGFDTTYWRLAENGLLDEHSVYVEIDFPNVINRKISLIKKSEKLKSYLDMTEIQDDSCIKRLNSNFFLLCADLSNLKVIESLFKEIKIDFNIPTLFLSECAVTYMKVEDSNKLINWSAQSFSNGSFVNYEQIHPEDGFGNVMLKHFDKLQSTLHSVIHYPDKKSHEDRYQLLGFARTMIISEWDCFLHFTTDKERERVLTLEQFDEFEEFHLKCSHYVVAIATNNILTLWLDSMFDLKSSLVILDDSRNHFNIEKREEDLELFAHASCCLGRDTVLIFGGFGRTGRSRRVYKYCRKKLEEVQVVGSGNYKLDMIHGSAMSFEMNGKTYIGLYGGRLSPNNVVNNGELLVMEYSENVLIFKKCLELNFVPRYRHSVICHSLNGLSVWIFGGRTKDLKQTLPELWQFKIDIDEKNDIFISDLNDIRKNSAPSPRMSHSAVISSGNDAIYLSCGLDTQNFSVLNDLWKWSFATENWKRIEAKNRNFIPRYGHTSHIKDNLLYLIGGVNTSSGYQPGLALFNLDTFHLVELNIQSFRTEPLLLFNHTSALIDDEDRKIIIFGGGGNCFSFGTYFNKTICAIPLEQFSCS